MKIALDLHDFSVVNSRLDLLLELKSKIPNLKISMLTVPCDTPQDWGMYQIRKQNLEIIKKNLDWIQIIPHGFNHNSGNEMLKYDYKSFKELMKKIGECFKRDGLPYEKGFCAPHWRWTQGVVDALDEAGWFGVIDDRQKWPKTKKFYRYNYKLDEDFGDDELLKLHGHVYGTKNDIGLNFNKLLTNKIKNEAEWHFITDFIEAND